MSDSFLKDEDFSKLVKKAKRTSMIRNVFISVVVCLILLYGLYFLGSVVMHKMIDKEISDEMEWGQIMGANVEQRGGIYSYTPFSATVTSRSIKLVGGVPIPWGGQEKAFTVFGTSGTTEIEFPMSSGGISEECIPSYLNGNRVIEFYHPNVDYKKLCDERPLLDEIRADKLVEFALSFDKPYTIKEVEHIFSNHSVWYWVDTYSPDELATWYWEDPDLLSESEMTVSGGFAFGFQDSEYQEEGSLLSFIEQIKWITKSGGVYQDHAKELLANLTNNGQHELTPANLKIIGVVVTGTPDELKKYNDLPLIRAAILGATTDQY